MPPKPSKKSSTVPNSPPRPRRSGRKRARSSLDATVAPPNKKLAMEDEEGEIEAPVCATYIYHIQPTS
jgi:hypothetical protein